MQPRVERELNAGRSHADTDGNARLATDNSVQGHNAHSGTQRVLICSPAAQTLWKKQKLKRKRTEKGGEGKSKASVARVCFFFSSVLRHCRADQDGLIATCKIKTHAGLKRTNAFKHTKYKTRIHFQ